MHQIYRITESMIGRATDEQSRQFLIQERDKRNSEERFEKLKVQLVLVADFLLVAYLSWTLVPRASADR
jgi:hypothetical protein